MRKLNIFYIINIVWIIVFFLLILKEDATSKFGLAALEKIGHIYLYAILCIIGVVLLVIIFIIDCIKRIRRRKKINLKKL